MKLDPKIFDELYHEGDAEKFAKRVFHELDYWDWQLMIGMGYSYPGTMMEAYASGELRDGGAIDEAGLKGMEG